MYTSETLQDGISFKLSISLHQVNNFLLMIFQKAFTLTQLHLATLHKLSGFSVRHRDNEDINATAFPFLLVLLDVPNLQSTSGSHLLYTSFDPISALYILPLSVGHCPWAAWLLYCRTDTEMSGLSWRAAPGISNAFYLCFLLCSERSLSFKPANCSWGLMGVSVWEGKYGRRNFKALFCAEHRKHKRASPCLAVGPAGLWWFLFICHVQLLI